MKDRIFREVLEETISLYGFKKENKSYFKNCDDVVVMIDLQKIGYRDNFYIHYGYYLEKLHPKMEEITLLNCDFTGKFVMEHEGDSLFTGKMTTDQYKIFLENNIEKYILPILEEGDNNSFELQP